MPKPVPTHVSTQPVTSSTKSPVKPVDPSKSFRPMGGLLHGIGLRLVREQIYKGLIEIQEFKESNTCAGEGSLVNQAEGLPKRSLQSVISLFDWRRRSAGVGIELGAWRSWRNTESMAMLKNWAGEQ